MAEDNKTRIPLWLYPDTIKKADELFPKDNCKSRSEFIEKAIIFYCGYMTSGENNKFLPSAITSTLAGIVENSENRMARLLFKLAVEMSMMMNVLASNAEIDETLLQKLPDTADLFEYEDYLKNRTRENASEFLSIALENNLDLIGKKKNFVDYIANRPRVEKHKDSNLPELMRYAENFSIANVLKRYLKILL